MPRPARTVLQTAALDAAFNAAQRAVDQPTAVEETTPLTQTAQKNALRDRLDAAARTLEARDSRVVQQARDDRAEFLALHDPLVQRASQAAQRIRKDMSPYQASMHALVMRFSNPLAASTTILHSHLANVIERWSGLGKVLEILDRVPTDIDLASQVPPGSRRDRQMEELAKRIEGWAAVEVVGLARRAADYLDEIQMKGDRP